MFVRRRQLAVRSLAMLFVSGFDAANAQLAARKPAGANAPATLPSKETLIARAKRFELNTPYVPPPGQGYDLMSGRDWARLGNLYLQDGVWHGERILPEGFVRFVSTVAPAWAADGRPIYGGFFWINGDGKFPVPRESYYMSGAGGQTVLVIPSHDLVVVRIGQYRGNKPGTAAFTRALAILMEAVH